MNGRNSKTKKLAYAAMGSALSFVLLFIGTTAGVLDMSASVICGIITVFLMCEIGPKFTSCAVTVCTVLSLVLLPDKSIGILYFMAGGIYPIVKTYTDRKGLRKSKLLKLAAFEVIICIYSALLLILMPSEFNVLLLPMAFIVGTLVFILYDILLTRFTVIYERQLKHIINRSGRRNGKSDGNGLL